MNMEFWRGFPFIICIGNKDGEQQMIITKELNNGDLNYHLGIDRNNDSVYSENWRKSRKLNGE